MSRWLKRFLFLLILAAAGYYVYSCAASPHAAPAAQSAPSVSVAAVIERNIQQWHEFSGRLAAVNSAEIRPRVGGTIDAIHFKEGQRVRKGEPLFTIDPRPYRAALESAEARATLAEADYDRAKALMKDKAIAQRDFDQRRNAAEVARADLTTARLNLDYTLIKAPFAGRAGRAEITLGNLVDAGGNAPILTTLVADRPIYADFDIDEESFLHYLQSAHGDNAKLAEVPVYLGLSGEDGAPHEGHIHSFDNQLNARSGTMRVRAVFPNDDGALIPGLFARIRLGTVAEAPAFLISDRAVGTDQNKKFVLLVGPDNKVEYREVKLGPLSDGLRIVTSGLQGGDKIIVSGLQRARPGAAVTPEMVGMEESGQQPATGDQKKENKMPDQENREESK